MAFGLTKKKKKQSGIRCAAVVAAAGSSTRMDGRNKLFVELDGKPVLVWTLLALDSCDAIDDIVVVTRKPDIDAVAVLCRAHHIKKIFKVVAGGESRQESVYRGALEVPEDTQLIAVHDGARPFVTEMVIQSAVSAAAQYGAAAPSVPVVSTVKEAKNGTVIRTLDRSTLFEIQTPQVFDAAILKGALHHALEKGITVTDDCMAVESLGYPVHLTPGARENIKLTTAADIAFANAILDMRRKS
ncbi:2-C-methyl-D-erythritol 4-phosphate cytidylyltransferase [Oscillospiraceae bacterium WX1]